MNDRHVADVQLQAFEARLATLAPQLPLAEQQQLLYRCAFSAGRMTVGSTLRRWQGATVAAIVVALGLSIPVARQYGGRAKQNLVIAQPRDVIPGPMRAQPEFPNIARQSKAVALGAWQVRSSTDASIANDLARFEQTDPHIRSLAVGVLTRAMLEQ